MKRPNLLLLILTITLMLSQKTFARVQVAFFEAYYRNGQRVELTEEGRYYHVAIRAAGKWYHAIPREGVTRLQSINNTPGLRLVEVLENLDMNIRYNDIKPFLDLSFDHRFHWHDTKTTYCSKFIAQLLEVDPRPMSFSSRHWDKAHNIDKSGVGVSPDYLFDALLDKGFRILPLRVSSRKAKRCSRLFSY